jgi:hypothetical protein
VRRRLAFVAVLLCALTAPAADAAVRVEMTPATVSTRLGNNFTVTSAIRSGSAQAGLIAHLNVVSVTPGVYVDPEDWSSSRTSYLPPLRPGKPVKVPWKIKTVSGGRFAIYVVVLPRGGCALTARPLTVSPAVAVHVQEHRTLNSGGVLPLALGIPAGIGLLALALRTRRRA